MTPQLTATRPLVKQLARSLIAKPRHVRPASGGAHYNAPSGYLFGEKPSAPGQKRVKEDWETIYYWGMGGGMALAAVLLYYKPDTSIEGWARKEAKAKMAAAGETREMGSWACRGFLAKVEQGSKNHEVVPLGLIAQIAGLRTGGVNKSLAELGKRRLVAKVQHSKYEGVRLTYGGYDFLACRTFAKRDTVYSVGNQIGTGKESDIYVVADAEDQQLGRLSFRTIKSKRDYLRKGQSASWMYMSRLAAMKEFAFMKILHEHEFPVPLPIDQSRHCIVMELIDAFPLRQIASVPDPGALYSALMDLIVRLAQAGLIHGDFNEFNILIRDHRTDAERERDEESPEERLERIERQGGDHPVIVDESDITDARRRCGLLEPVLIDFPQMVRFKYESALYPRFAQVCKEGDKVLDLDVAASASGFTKKDKAALEEYIAQIRERGPEGTEEDSSESRAHSESGESSTPRDDREDGNRSDVSGGDMGQENAQEDADDNRACATTAVSEDADPARDGRRVERTTHRTQVDITAVVADKLKRSKIGNERKHHGKKPASAQLLGRQRGSKPKQDARRGIKDADIF
ncbi:Serine/threonine-protein kinase rio2 [Microbotryomycetes sp. JL221]|nr:Serine/threonine-protein kinase rio2 [Microbotryomycetes sp. JL221]